MCCRRFIEALRLHGRAWRKIEGMQGQTSAAAMVFKLAVSALIE